MKLNLRSSSVLLVVLMALTVSIGQSPVSADDEKSRQFEFAYQASITDVSAGANVRIWIPVASNNAFQSVKLLSQSLPGEAKMTSDEKYGNKMLYLERVHQGSGNIGLRIVYHVLRNEARSLGHLDKQQSEGLKLFLGPNAKVPISGKPLETFQSYLEKNSIELASDPLKNGRVVYDFVDNHMKYDKSQPGYGEGDSVWACDSQTGNCTDFHSLFISVARAKKIPAKFQIGFPLPPARGQGTIGGYHCWAQFHTAERGWIPVDISEADKDPSKKEYFFGKLNENRVHFTTGRDLDLSPKQAGPPLNYFIYPYVEVDGKPYPKEKIKLTFRYRDTK